MMLHWFPWRNPLRPRYRPAAKVAAAATGADAGTKTPAKTSTSTGVIPSVGSATLDLTPAMALAAPPLPPAIAAARRRERIRATFGPTQPVENRAQLLGRDVEIARLIDVTMNLRSHALVFGARGAGKTSLVRAFGDHADELGMLVIYLSCGAGGTFSSIFRPYLDFLPPSAFPLGEEAAIRAQIEALPQVFDARALANILSQVDGRDVIFIIDEFDRVDDAAIRGEIASLVKLLSDLRAPVMLVFVGIARNVTQLIDGHASLRRHLVAVRVPRFEQEHVATFFDSSELASGLRFPADVRRLIGSIAAGSPYHLRLFSMHAAFEAVRADTDILTPALVAAGLRSAFSNWASVNPATAAAFERNACDGNASRRRLVALAMLALDLDRFTPDEFKAQLDGGPLGDADGILALLNEALLPFDDQGALQFEDPLAPQFLLLACFLAAQNGESERDNPPLRQRGPLAQEFENVLGPC